MSIYLVCLRRALYVETPLLMEMHNRGNCDNEKGRNLRRALTNETFTAEALRLSFEHTRKKGNEQVNNEYSYLYKSSVPVLFPPFLLTK